MIKKALIVLGLSFFCSGAFAQFDTSKAKVQFSGFVDFYYLYDFNNPFPQNRGNYVFAYSSHNELNINLGLIKAAYQSDKVFANLALQTGTYASANYAAEPAVFRSIAEANVGIKLTEKLTFDAGVFPSHIGVESAINQNCYNLTRSLMADGSPYFETGARLKYNFNSKLELSALVLNGWQNIAENNQNKALGAQLMYQPTEKITLNYSNFYGNEQPLGSPALMRLFHDFYIQYHNILPNLSATVVFDYMTQENLNGGLDEVYTYSAMLYYKLNQIGFGGRYEHYNDPMQVINVTGSFNGFQVTSGSVNFDCYIRDGVMWRFEAKNYQSVDAILLTNDPLKNAGNAFLLATSLSMAF